MSDDIARIKSANKRLRKELKRVIRQLRNQRKSFKSVRWCYDDSHRTTR